MMAEDNNVEGVKRNEGMNVEDEIQYADLVDSRTGRVVKSAFGQNFFRDRCNGQKQPRPCAIRLTFLEEDYGSERRHVYDFLKTLGIQPENCLMQISMVDNDIHLNL